MMVYNFLEYFRTLPYRSMWRYIAGYMVFCVLILAGAVGYYLYMVQDHKTKMSQLNKARAQVQNILTKYQFVQEQKNSVAATLKQNKSFNIQKYFQELLVKNGLADTAKVTFKRQKLSNGYVEESLQVTCSNITTKQLCQLLFALEQERLVYVGSVDITHVVGAKKISVMMTIATLRAEE